MTRAVLIGAAMLANLALVGYKVWKEQRERRQPPPEPPPPPPPFDCPIHGKQPRITFSCGTLYDNPWQLPDRCFRCYSEVMAMMTDGYTKDRLEAAKDRSEGETGQ
jgi:hypothetical protein